MGNRPIHRPGASLVVLFRRLVELIPPGLPKSFELRQALEDIAERLDRLTAPPEQPMPSVADFEAGDNIEITTSGRTVTVTALGAGANILTEAGHPLEATFDGTDVTIATQGGTFDVDSKLTFAGAAEAYNVDLGETSVYDSFLLHLTQPEQTITESGTPNSVWLNGVLKTTNPLDDATLELTHSTGMRYLDAAGALMWRVGPTVDCDTLDVSTDATVGSLYTDGWAGFVGTRTYGAIDGCVTADNLLSNRDVHGERHVYPRIRCIVGHGRQSWTGLPEGSIGITSEAVDSTAATPTPHPDCQQTAIYTDNTGTHFKHHTVDAIEGSVSQKFQFDDEVTAAGALVSTLASGTGLDVTADAVLRGDLNVVGDSFLEGSVTVGGDADMTGNATVAGTLGVTSNATIGGTLGVTGTATFSGSASVANKLNIGSATGTTAGRVGIKTNSSAQELQVYSDADICYFDASGGGGTNGIFQFRAPSGTPTNFRALSQGTNQQAVFNLGSTGNATASFRIGKPGASGTTANTFSNQLRIDRTSAGVDFDCQDNAADVGIRFLNAFASYVANASVEGRLGVGTTTPPTSGAYVQTPSLAVNGGTAMSKLLRSTGASGAFTVNAQDTETFTVTVTGAATGDVVQLGAPSTIEADLTWSAYVSTANTVTVRLSNPTAGNIAVADQTWSVMVCGF